MEIVIGIVVLGAVIYYFTVFRKVSRWNNDEKQKQLVQLLIAAGHGDTIGVTNFIIEQSLVWQPPELRERLVHALTLVKPLSEPAVYEGAKQYAMLLHDSSYRLG